MKLLKTEDIHKVISQFYGFSIFSRGDFCSFFFFIFRFLSFFYHFEVADDFWNILFDYLRHNECDISLYLILKIFVYLLK